MKLKNGDDDGAVVVVVVPFLCFETSTCVVNEDEDECPPAGSEDISIDKAAAVDVGTDDMMTTAFYMKLIGMICKIIRLLWKYKIRFF
jgi:hypothetical protein